MMTACAAAHWATVAIRADQYYSRKYILFFYLMLMHVCQPVHISRSLVLSVHAARIHGLSVNFNL